jgi:hypothetical protein
MNKRLTTAFTVFSFLVFTFLIVWFVSRTINTRSGNLLSAREELERLSQTVSSSYLAGGSFGSSYFSEKVMKKIDDAGRLKALVVSTDPGQVEFVYAVSKGYLSSELDYGKPVAIPVAFSFNSVTEESLSTTSIVPSAEDIRLDAVFGILGRTEVFPVVRELLIGLLSFLLITAILIILYPFLSAKTEKAMRFQMASRTGETGSETQPPTMAPETREEEVTTIREEATVVAESVRSVASEETPVIDTQTVTETAAGGLYSPSTELGWEQYLEERLSAELKRAASFDQDLVLLLGCVNGLTRSDPFYAELSRMAREFFNFQDLCFEYSTGGIGIIIPNVDLDQGIERVEGFKNRVDRGLDESGSGKELTLGLSARNGRLISGKRIIREAKSALRRAGVESAGITAFRVDPEKYRTYISSRKSSIQS